MDEDEKRAYEEGKASKLAELKQKRIDAARAKGAADATKEPLGKQFVKEGFKQLKGLFK